MMSSIATFSPDPTACTTPSVDPDLWPMPLCGEELRTHQSACWPLSREGLAYSTRFAISLDHNPLIISEVAALGGFCHTCSCRRHSPDHPDTAGAHSGRCGYTCKDPAKIQTLESRSWYVLTQEILKRLIGTCAHAHALASASALFTIANSYRHGRGCPVHWATCRSASDRNGSSQDVKHLHGSMSDTSEKASIHLRLSLKGKHRAHTMERLKMHRYSQRLEDNAANCIQNGECGGRCHSIPLCLSNPAQARRLIGNSISSFGVSNRSGKRTEKLTFVRSSPAKTFAKG